MRILLFLSLLISSKSAFSQVFFEETFYCDNTIITSLTTEKSSKNSLYCTPIIAKRLFGTKKDFAVIRFAKQKKRPPFIFIKLEGYNICIQKNEILEITFRDGDKTTIKNNYKLNCDGYFIGEISKKNLPLFDGNPIKHVRLFSFDKDYEIPLELNESETFLKNLDCLQNYP